MTHPKIKTISTQIGGKGSIRRKKRVKSRPSILKTKTIPPKLQKYKKKQNRIKKNKLGRPPEPGLWAGGGR